MEAYEAPALRACCTLDRPCPAHAPIHREVFADALEAVGVLAGMLEVATGEIERLRRDALLCPRCRLAVVRRDGSCYVCDGPVDRAPVAANANWTRAPVICRCAEHGGTGTTLTPGTETPTGSSR